MLLLFFGNAFSGIYRNVSKYSHFNCFMCPFAFFKWSDDFMDNLLWLDSTSTMPRCDPRPKNDLLNYITSHTGHGSDCLFLSKLHLKRWIWSLDTLADLYYRKVSWHYCDGLSHCWFLNNLENSRTLRKTTLNTLEKHSLGLWNSGLLLEQKRTLLGYW